MIKKVTIINHVGEQIELELESPEKSGLAIRSITGIGPTKADIRTTEVTTNDISLYNSARLQTRNIVFQLIMYKDLIEDARRLVYKYFPLKKKITMIFETDKRTVVAEGYVESDEVEIFSELEECQVSVICPNPYFYDGLYDTLSETFHGMEHTFEFEFHNDSLTEPLLEFGHSMKREQKIIQNYGDSDVGLTIRLHCVGQVINPVFYNVYTSEKMVIDSDKIRGITGSDLKAGDDVIICTEKGNKYINLYRDGNFINIIGALRSYATWLIAKRGQSSFAFDAEDGYRNMEVTYSYRILYEGI